MNSLTSNTSVRGSTFSLTLGAQGLLLIMILVSLFTGLVTNELQFDDITAITIASLIVFVVISIGGIVSTRLYFVFLVFQLIALPSAVDNVIPGVYQGDRSELNASIFPLFTHVDIYLVIGIIKGLIRKRGEVARITSITLAISVLILFASSLINIWYSADPQDFYLIVAGFIHLRYLIWFYLLFSLFCDEPMEGLIVDGLILSVLFLFIESLVFTRISGADRLSSGSLGNNSYGNVIASITVYLIYVFKIGQYRKRGLLLLSISVGIVIVVLTETRMAILCGLLLFFVGYYFHNRKSFGRLLIFVLLFLAVGVAIMSTDLYRRNVPRRLDIAHLASMVHFNPRANGLRLIEIESSIETNSLYTRFKLYDASLRMIEENPFFGIGSMRWNYHKGEYGYDERVLIDTHNGYLAVISQFGLLSVAFIYFIYFYPLKFMSRKYRMSSSYSYLALISIGMAISDLSNAGVYKHQIYGLLCLIVMLLLVKKHRIQLTLK